MKVLLKFNPKNILILFLKGFSMGLADLVPGISGSTIALILNIYDRFILSIKNIASWKTLKLFFSLEFKKLFNHIDLLFILPLILGLFSCLFTLPHLISFLLQEYPIQFWSFFFGLILTSSLLLPDYSTLIQTKNIFLFLLGILFGYLIINLTTYQTPETSWMTFISGMIAISTMLLPGISGSFLLVVIGKYEFMVNAIKNLDWNVIIIFTLGGLVVLVTLPKIISWVFKKNREYFMVFIAGFLIGSINKIWPWKTINPENLAETSVSPFYYESSLGQSPYLWSAVFFFFLGIFIILLVNYLDKKFLKNSIKNKD